MCPHARFSYQGKGFEETTNAIATVLLDLRAVAFEKDTLLREQNQQESKRLAAFAFPHFLLYVFRFGFENTN